MILLKMQSTMPPFPYKVSDPVLFYALVLVGEWCFHGYPGMKAKLTRHSHSMMEYRCDKHSRLFVAGSGLKLVVACLLQLYLFLSYMCITTLHSWERILVFVTYKPYNYRKNASSLLSPWFSINTTTTTKSGTS